MTDSWDEVLDWERWAKEVLTDWRVPFDNHKVGLRLGITQQLCDLRDERDALAARLAEAERLLVEGMDAIEGNGAWKSTWDAMRLFLYGTTVSATGQESESHE